MEHIKTKKLTKDVPNFVPICLEQDLEQFIGTN